MIFTKIIFFVSITLAYIFSLKYYLHMFQLESYLKIQYFKWIKQNFVTKVLAKVLPLIVSGLVVVYKPNVVTLIIASVFNSICILLYKGQKAKKPLVFTTRVWRLVVTSFVIYALFLILSVFISIYFITPLVVALTSFIVIASATINAPVEKAVRNKYINEAKKIIKSRKKNLCVIGITGSYGKTSTKFYLEKMLSKKYNVLMTPASYNTTMGVVKVIREMLRPSHEIFICEMGARNTGEIKEICDIVLPDIGIITSIGPQHLETFKSIENVIKTKFELADAVNDKSFVLLNSDNEYILNKPKEDKFIYYGVDNKNASYYADNITLSSKGTDFDFVYPGGVVHLSTKLLGKHNVLNICACAAMSIKLGVDANDIKVAVRMLESVPHRLEIIDSGDVVIIDDAFNSNQAGAKYALDVLSVFDGLRILVTPGMVELGEKQNELNYNFGVQAGNVCDYIFIVGKVNFVNIYNGVKSTKFDIENKLFNVSSPTEAVDKARKLSDEKIKYILLENDLPDNFN